MAAIVREGTVNPRVWYPLLFCATAAAGGAATLAQERVNLTGVLFIPIGIGLLALLAAAVPALRSAPYLAPLLAGLVLVDFAGFSPFGYLLVGDVLLVGAFLMWKLERAVETRGDRFEHPIPLYLFIGMYVAGTALSTPSSVDLAEALSILAHFTLLFAVLTPILIRLIAEEETVARIIFPAVIVAAIVHSVGILALVARGAEWKVGDRINGLFDSEVQLLMASGFVGCVAIAWLERDRPRLRLGALMAVPVVGAALAVTRYRAAWVAALVGVVVLLWVVEPRRRTAGVAGILFVVGGLWLAYSAQLFPAAIQDRISMTFETGVEDVELRVVTARELTDTLMQHPLVGIGPGQSPYYLPAGFVAAKVGFAHNAILNATIEGGLIAGIGFLGALVAVIVYGGRAVKAAPSPQSRRLRAWAYASTVGIIVGLQFVPTIYARTFFVLAAAAVAYQLQDRRTEQARVDLGEKKARP